VSLDATPSKRAHIAVLAPMRQVTRFQGRNSLYTCNVWRRGI